MANWDRKFSNGTYYTAWNGRLVYTLNSQNTAANTSNITLTLQAFADSSSYYQTGAWDARIYINGSQVASATPSVYVSNTPVTLVSYTGNVTHAANGTLTITLGDYINAPVNEMVYGTQSWTLPTINRYATISSFTSSNVTDVGFSLNVTTDVTCDQLEWSTNNGSTYTTVAGDFTTKAVAVGGNLPSDTLYATKVRVRRKDSQLTTTSSTVNVTTNTQNNFMALL